MVLGRKEGRGEREEKQAQRRKRGRKRKRFKYECYNTGHFLFSAPAGNFDFELLPSHYSPCVMGFYLRTLVLNAKPFSNHSFMAWKPNNVRTFSE